jgi:type II secretory pathway pseudopilin PulG
MPSGERGYTYLLVLFLVAGLGLFAAETGVVWQHATQREREADLLAIGVEFARAIGSYRKASPDGALPETLQQLVEDRRGPALVRHLRRIYRDPLTGDATWGLEKAGGRIGGIFSLAPGVPIRKHDLPAELAIGETGVERYADWVFRPADGDAAAKRGEVPRAAGPVSAPAQQ